MITRITLQLYPAIKFWQEIKRGTASRIIWNYGIYITPFDLVYCPLFLDEIKIVKTVFSQTLMFAMNQPVGQDKRLLPSSFSMALGVLRKCPCTLKVCTLRNKESASSNISVSESSAPLLPHFAVCTVIGQNFYPKLTST